MTGWQPIETAPKDGTRIALRRDDCPGYDTHGVWDGSAWMTAAFFIRADMRLLGQPTHWRAIAGPVNGTSPDAEAPQ